MADTKPGEINEKSGLRTVSTEDANAYHAKLPRTKPNSHRAIMKGYAVPDNANGAGVIVEVGDIVPANVPVSDEWMEKIGKAKHGLETAVEEAIDPHPKDVDLTKLNVAALQAMAAERGINVEQDGTPLSKKDLIAAIGAARENDAG